MTAEIFDFTGITRLNVSPDRGLKKCVGKLESVVVMGYDKDGEEYFASSLADGGTVLWLMERLKKRLIEVPEDVS